MNGFEEYQPATVPAMPEDEAREIAKDLMVALIEVLFERLDCEALVTESELASYLNGDEQERISKLVNSARLEVVVSWDEG